MNDRVNWLIMIFCGVFLTYIIAGAVSDAQFAKRVATASHRRVVDVSRAIGEIEVEGVKTMRELRTEMQRSNDRIISELRRTHKVGDR